MALKAKLTEREGCCLVSLQVSHLILSNFDPRLSSIPARAQYFDEGNKTYKTSVAVNFELKFYSNYDLNL